MFQFLVEFQVLKYTSDTSFHISSTDHHDNEPSTSSFENVTKRKNKKDEYIESFTVHGLSRIFTGTRSESLFWSIVVFIGIALSSYVIYELISKYFRFEVYTSVSSVVSINNTFPSVTFCDFNMMKKNYFAYCGIDATNSSAKHPEQNKPCNYSKLYKPQKIMNQIKSGYGWSNGIFIITSCTTFGSVNCATDEYIQSLQALNNSCFTVNWNGNLHDTYGLVNIEFEMNTTNSIQYSDVMTTTQEHEVQEINLQHSIFLEPSKTYQLMVKKTGIIRLPHPFPSNCNTAKGNDIFPGKYTRTTCLESVNFVNMLKFCGDTLDHAKQFIPKEILSKYGRTNQTINETLSCMKLYAARKVVSDRTLCPIPCNEIELETRYTFHTLRKIDRKIYRIAIQLQSGDSYKVIEEKQLFTWDQIAGQVGGFLGLVVGASFISIIEIIAYLALCLIQKCCRKLF